MKRKRRSYKNEWFKWGVANGLRIAGVILGRTHTLEGERLIPIKREKRPIPIKREKRPHG